MWLRRQYFDHGLIEAGFSRGFVRDVPRHAIPPDGSYTVHDYLVDVPGKLRKRGGTSYQSAALSGENDIIGMAAPEFPGDPRVVAFASDTFNTTAYDITTDTPGSGQDCNSALIIENPPLYVDRLIVCDGNLAHTVQKVYLDTGVVVVDDLGGTPPIAKYSTVHAGRLVLANGIVSSTSYPQRVWFSDPLDAEQTWDTDNSYIDVSEEITGLASIQGVLIVFSRGGNQRILGDIPPGYNVPDNEVNMSLQPASHCGCIDARSLVKDEAWVYVANENGIFRVNGAGDQSMTTKSDGNGIAAYWTDAIYRFAPALGSVVASGIYLDHLFVTVTRRANEEAAITGQRTQLVCFLPTGAWTTMSGGVGGTMYATRFAPFYEMYFGLNDESDPSANQARLMSSIFTPAAANKNDADGTAIEPEWETRTLGLQAGIGMKHYDLAHLTYSLTADTGDDPTLVVEESSGLEADGAFAAVGESPFAETSGIARKRFSMSRATQGLSLRMSQDGSSAETEIQVLELNVRNLQPGGGTGT